MQPAILLHPVKNLFMGRFLVLVYFQFFISSALSQDFHQSTWYHIDSSVEAKRNLSDISALLDRLNQKAWQEKKYFDLARTYYYRVKIADLRTEDTMYFHNSAVYDSLLMTHTDKPALQYAVELLLAKRLAAFQETY